MQVKQRSFESLGLTGDDIYTLETLYVSKSKLDVKPGDLVNFIFDVNQRGRELVCDFAFKISEYDDLTYKLVLDIATPVAFKSVDHSKRFA